MRRLLLPVLGLAAIAVVAAHAQTAVPPRGAPGTAAVDPALFRGLEYRLLGPSRGGRVTAVTGVPSQPATFYMGVSFRFMLKGP
jgi:hypothetical protein